MLFISYYCKPFCMVILTRPIDQDQFFFFFLSVDTQSSLWAGGLKPDPPHPLSCTTYAATGGSASEACQTLCRYPAPTMAPLSSAPKFTSLVDTTGPEPRPGATSPCTWWTWLFTRPTGKPWLTCTLSDVMWPAVSLMGRSGPLAGWRMISD